VDNHNNYTHSANLLYIMSATNLERIFFANFALPRRELLEIHRTKISLHRAKAGYSYPTIRLPHAFSKLAGLSTRICQTVHEGALAFLVVISSTENASESSKTSVFTRRRSGVRIASSPSVFFDSETHKLSFIAHFFSHRSSYFFILALRVRIHHAHSIRRAALKATSRMRRRTTAFTAFIIRSHFNRASWFVCS
jgi:hypothetical protein